MTSDEDTYLVLCEYDTDDSISCVENDDYEGLGTNSKIEWTPSVDKAYQIEITTYEAETVGDFTLTLEGAGGIGDALSLENSIGQSQRQRR